MDDAGVVGGASSVTGVDAAEGKVLGTSGLGEELNHLIVEQLVVGRAERNRAS